MDESFTLHLTFTAYGVTRVVVREGYGDLFDAVRASGTGWTARTVTWQPRTLLGGNYDGNT